MNKVFGALIVSGLLLIAAADCFAAGDKLAGKLQELAPGDEARVIVKLTDQLDPESVTTGVRGRNKALRTSMLVRALKDKKDKTQKDLLKLIGEWKGKGRAKNVKEFWIFNGVALTAPREVLDEIAAMPEVAEIYPDETIPLETPIPAAAPVEGNLDAVNAPEMWALGFTGQGVVVASMDSGVDYLHPDLSGSYRGGTNSWYDPNGQHATPFDPDGHGTETMGVMVGGSAGGTAIGVAPGAKWIAVKIFDDSGVALESVIHLGFQWLLDPDGNPLTGDAPDVVNNSWGIVGKDAPPGSCVQKFAPDVAALRAAGIVPVFAAGNYGPVSPTDISPANNAGSISVGATDDFDNPQLFSSRGPNSCSKGVFPLLAAPGLSIRTTTLSYGGLPVYASVSGTSFSAPHVSGAVALLLSASPILTVDQVETALVSGAYDISPAGPDNDTGFGRVDALAAYEMASDSALVSLALVGPADGAVLWARTTHTFTWQAVACYGFEVQFSRTPDFAIMRSLVPPPGGALMEYTPVGRAWRKLRRLGRRGATVYWRVKGTALNGDTVYSDTRTFTISRTLPTP